jgi:DNA-binding response OmpR family regulator
VVLPADQFFSHPELRRGPGALELVAYGPDHLFRASWLAGALDYLREPWSVDELFLRLRGPQPGITRWETGSERAVLEGSVLSAGGQRSVKLSPAEAEVLRLLVQRRGMPVSRTVLAWRARCSSGRVIDTLVGRLRAKLKNAGPGGAVVPEAVRGVGYRLP